ncbi:MAG TPA: effector-associated domain EAD1-containing protein [Chloroflexia bacterium]|nr:effector-associated domain EAD1-containing protein [Chloroflexia bacterium]
MLTTLSGPQMRQLHEALLAAFPQEEQLRLLVRFELNKTLSTLVKSDTLSAMVLELLEWAEAQGKLEDLLQGALNTNPDNPQLKAFVARVGLAAVTPPAAPPAPIILPATPETDTFPKWHALLSDLASGQCTPILGPGLLEPLLGASRDLARRWAETFRFPLGPRVPEDLPQVAQFLATVESPNTLRQEFRKYLVEELITRHGTQVPGLDRTAAPDDLLRAVAAARWLQNPADPFRVLAALPCPLYITANLDNLLAEALRAAGKAPEVELCRWLDDDRWPPSIYDREPDYQPTVARPLVYHLFGRLPLPFSLVLKEDDYFEYLVGVTRLARLVPTAVRAALSDSALLFLGFQLDDWGFRVLFRSIIRQGVPGRRGQYTHVAVQIDPTTANTPEAAGARRYLQSYFESADVTIYWGRVEQFLSEFQAHWTRYQAGEGPR